MEKLKNILSPGHKDDDDILYGTGEQSIHTGRHNTGTLSGEGSHLAAATGKTDDHPATIPPDSAKGWQETSPDTRTDDTRPVNQHPAPISSTTATSATPYDNRPVGPETTATAERNDPVTASREAGGLSAQRPAPVDGASVASIKSGVPGNPPPSSSTAAPGQAVTTDNRNEPYYETQPGGGALHDSSTYTDRTYPLGIPSRTKDAPANQTEQPAAGREGLAGAAASVYEKGRPTQETEPPRTKETSNVGQGHFFSGPAVADRTQTTQETAPVTQREQQSQQPSEINPALAAATAATAGPVATAGSRKDDAVKSDPEKQKSSTTSGPHKSSILNKLDPRVDSKAHEKQQEPSAEDSGDNYGRNTAVAGGAGGAAALAASPAFKRDEEPKAGAQADSSSYANPYSSHGVDPRVDGDRSAATHPSDSQTSTRQPAIRTTSNTYNEGDRARRASQSQDQYTPGEQGHSGRDAALVGGGTAAGAGAAYGLSRSDDRRDPSQPSTTTEGAARAPADDKEEGKEKKGFLGGLFHRKGKDEKAEEKAAERAVEPSTSSAAPVGTTDRFDSQRAETTSQPPPRTIADREEEDHTGRNVAFAGGATAIGAGTAAYAYSKHDDENERAAEAEKLRQQQAREREQQLAREREEEERLERERLEREQKEHEKAQREAEKQAAKEEKHHKKEIEKEEKKHQKEVEKEQKKHDKEVAAAEKAREKEAAKEEREREKAAEHERQQREKELAAAEAERERERERQREGEDVIEEEGKEKKGFLGGILHRKDKDEKAIEGGDVETQRRREEEEAERHRRQQAAVTGGAFAAGAGAYGAGSYKDKDKEREEDLAKSEARENHDEERKSSRLGSLFHRSKKDKADDDQDRPVAAHEKPRDDDHTARDAALVGGGAPAIGAGAYGASRHDEEQKVREQTLDSPEGEKKSRLGSLFHRKDKDKTEEHPSTSTSTTTTTKPTTTAAEHDAERGERDHTKRDALLVGGGAAAAGGAAGFGFSQYEKTDKQDPLAPTTGPESTTTHTAGHPLASEPTPVTTGPTATATGPTAGTAGTAGSTFEPTPVATGPTSTTYEPTSATTGLTSGTTAPTGRTTDPAAAYTGTTSTTGPTTSTTLGGPTTGTSGYDPTTTGRGAEMTERDHSKRDALLLGGGAAAAGGVAGYGISQYDTTQERDPIEAYTGPDTTKREVGEVPGSFPPTAPEPGPSNVPTGTAAPTATSTYPESQQYSVPPAVGSAPYTDTTATTATSTYPDSQQRSIPPAAGYATYPDATSRTDPTQQRTAEHPSAATTTTTAETEEREKEKKGFLGGIFHRKDKHADDKGVDEKHEDEGYGMEAATAAAGLGAGGAAAYGYNKYNDRDGRPIEQEPVTQPTQTQHAPVAEKHVEQRQHEPIVTEHPKKEKAVEKEVKKERKEEQKEEKEKKGLLGGIFHRKDKDEKAEEKREEDSHNKEKAATGVAGAGAAAYGASRFDGDRERERERELERERQLEKERELEREREHKLQRERDEADDVARRQSGESSEEKKKSRLGSLLHRHKDKKEGEDESAAPATAPTTVAGEEHHVGRNRLHKEPPEAVKATYLTQREQEERVAREQAEQDRLEREREGLTKNESGLVIEPRTGLPMDVDRYGPGAGGTDGNTTIPGFHAPGVGGAHGAHGVQGGHTATDPATGLPLDTGNYGSGAGGTDGGYRGA